MSSPLRRFDTGQRVADWLCTLPQPVHACYEAGPTGFGLHRVAKAAGIRVDVVAPTKTPRAAGDRVKTIARTPSCSYAC